MPRAKYDYSRGGVEKASLIDVVAVGIMETDDGKYVRIDIQKDDKEFHLAMSLEDCAFIEEAIERMRIEFPGVLPPKE